MKDLTLLAPQLTRLATPSVQEAAIYARVSSTAQRESSIDDQIFQCMEYAKTRGLVVKKENIFFDQGISGQDINRPGLQAIKKAVNDGRANFRTILIADTSRLARDVGDTADLRKFFEFAQITLTFVDNRMSSTDPGFATNHMLRSMMDEQFSQGLSEKVSRGLEGRFRDGYNPSGRCYGYYGVPEEDSSRTGLYGRPRVKGVVLQIHLEQAAVVRRIFEMYAGGMGYETIANTLNQEAVPTSTSRACGWCGSAISTILHNVRYIGIQTFNKTKAIRHPETRKTIQRPQDPSKHQSRMEERLRIIPQELWDAAHARMQKVREGKKIGSTTIGGMARTPASRTYLFSGLLHCGLCGGPIILGDGGSGNYSCRANRRGLNCTNKLRVKRTVLEAQLMESIVSKIRSGIEMDALKEEFLRQIQTRIKQDKESVARIDIERSSLEQELRSLQRKIDNVLSAIEEDGTSPSLKERLRQSETRKEAIKQLLAVGTRPIQKISEKEAAIFLEKGLEGLVDVLTDDPAAAKLELQKRITGLTLTPVLEDGRQMYLVAGDIGLFLGDEAVLLPCFVDNDVEQHAITKFSLNELVPAGKPRKLREKRSDDAVVAATSPVDLAA